LVGGPDGRMIANYIRILFGTANNWPLGAALSITSMLLVGSIALVYIWVTRKAMERLA